MIAPPDITRRDALRLLAVVGLSPLSCNDAAPAASPTADHIVALRPDRESAALLGRFWLESQLAPPSTAELLHGLAPRASIEGDALREALERAHRKDLSEERYESITGWQLSRTEVHLYALLARVT